MDLISNLQAAINDHISAEVARQIKEGIDEAVHDQVHAAFYGVPGLATGSTTVSPLAQLIDDRIAHFLKVELTTPLATHTEEKIMEMINNRIDQWVAEDLETEVDRIVDKALETHEEDKHDGSDVLTQAVVDAITEERSVKREIETVVRELLTNDLTARVTFD